MLFGWSVVTLEMMQKVLMEYRKRLEKILERGDGHSEVSITFDSLIDLFYLKLCGL